MYIQYTEIISVYLERVNCYIPARLYLDQLIPGIVFLRATDKITRSSGKNKICIDQSGKTKTTKMCCSGSSF